MKTFLATIILVVVAVLLVRQPVAAQSSADKITMRLRVVCNNGPGGAIVIAVDLKKFAGGLYIGGYAVNFGYNKNKMIFNSTSPRYTTQYWGFFYDAFDLSNQNLDRAVQQKEPSPGYNALPLVSQYFTPTSNCSGNALNDGFFEILRFTLTISGSAQGTADFIFNNWLDYQSGGGNPGAFETFVWNAALTDNFNDTKIEQKNIIVPVELVAFTGNSLPGGKVQLSWRTLTETSNIGFEVQRRNGEQWEKVGFVNGMGNSITEKEYSFIDTPQNNVYKSALFNQGKINYRLKQIDADGTESFSEIISVDLLPTFFTLGQSYPNPSHTDGQSISEILSIPYQLAVESNVNLAVYNSLGQKVADLVTDQKQNAGYYTINWDGQTEKDASLPPGVYFYRFTARLNNGESISSTKQFVLVR